MGSRIKILIVKDKHMILNLHLLAVIRILPEKRSPPHLPRPLQLGLYTP